MTHRSIFSNKNRVQWTVIVGLVVCGLLALHFFGSGRAATKSGENERPTPVTAARAVAKAVPVELTAIGHIQPIASVALRPRMDGQISKVLVKDGQDVKVGDVLIELDSRQAQAALDQAQANLARDEAQLEFAQHEAKRFATLLAQSAGSREQMEQAKGNAGALAGTVKADQAQVVNDEVELSFTQITAPISGRIGTIALKEGNNVAQASTTPLTTINQISPIYVSFSIPEREVSNLKQAIAKGPVKIDVSAPGDKQPAETGEVAYIENNVDTSTGTLGVHGTLPNAAERLWPGQFVNVVVTLRTEPSAIVVPSEAVQPGQDGNYVFVVKPDSTVDSRPVTVDRVIDTETVIAKGLKAGEQVVVTGQLRLTPGARVTTGSPNPNAGGKKPEASS